MKKRILILCHLLFIGFWGVMAGATALVAAEPGDVEKAEKEKASVKIEDVLVRGEVVGENLEATTATVLDNEDILNRIYITPLDIVTQSPGVNVTQYKQGGTASNFVMRGFTGNSHGSNTAIFLDGIPLNEGDGYADTNIINPDEIERVELIKGPSSAVYGNYASAGALAFYTKKQVDNQHLKLQYGAHNTYEANFVGGMTDDKWGQVYSIQNYHTDGYQDNSDWDKLNAAARITRRFSDAFSVRLSLRAFNSDWDSPGYINQAQFDEDPTQAVSETNGGGKDRLSARLDADYQINADSKALVYAWHYNQDFWRWYANDPTGLPADAVVGNLRDFKRNVYGTGASYNFAGLLGGRELRLTAGTDYLFEKDSRQRWNLEAGSGREKGDKFIDYDIEAHTIDFYTEGSYQVFGPLRAIVGARYDMFRGTLEDHLDNDTEYDMEDQNIFSPKAGLLLSLLENRLDIFANYGRGFALLPGFSELAAFRQSDWDPQERVQYEAGVRVRPTPWFTGQVALFQLETDKDFLYDAATDNYDNVGATTRKGIEVEADFTAFTFGYLHLDYAYIDAEYDTYSSGGVSFDGNTLRGVPASIFNVEFGYSPASGLGGRLRYHWEDGYYLDDANEFESEAWDRIDAQISYRFGSKAKYLVALDVVNLLDEKYADYTSGTLNKTYSPALPLSLYLTFNVDF